MCERAIGQGAVIHSVRELDGSQFNTTYLLELAQHAPLWLNEHSSRINELFIVVVTALAKGSNFSAKMIEGDKRTRKRALQVQSNTR
jgi:hypothetical protein